jgi:c(7)-type cytochrome triheme protein
MRNILKRSTVAATALLLAGSLAAAGGSLKLPPDKPLPQSPDSPGVVKFSHGSHVDAGKPNCTTCHPKPFAILGGEATKKAAAPITHEDMEAGRSCGTCHDGKAAHGLDDCTACHLEG